MFLVIPGFGQQSDLATFHKEILHYPSGLLSTHEGGSLNRTSNERMGEGGKKKERGPGRCSGWEKYLTMQNSRRLFVLTIDDVKLDKRLPVDRQHCFQSE